MKEHRHCPLGTLAGSQVLKETETVDTGMQQSVTKLPKQHTHLSSCRFSLSGVFAQFN